MLATDRVILLGQKSFWASLVTLYQLQNRKKPTKTTTSASCVAAAKPRQIEAHQLLKRDMSSPSKSPRDSGKEEEAPKVAEKWMNSYKEEPERERMNEPNESDPSETWTTEGGFLL